MTTAFVARRLLTAALSIIGGVGLPTAVTGQEPIEGAFVMLVGADTFAVENFSRHPDRLTSELSGPSIGRLEISATIGTDAAVRQLTLRFWTPGADPDSSPTQGATLTVRADTIDLDITDPPGIQLQRLPTVDGAFLFINPSFLLIEQMVLHARAAGEDIVEIPVYMAQGGATAPALVASPFAEAVRISIGSQIQAIMDPTGKLLSAAIPDQGLAIIRVDDVRLPAPGSGRPD